MKIKIFLLMCTVMTTYNPLKLYAQSLECIKSSIDNTTLKIIEKIYPNFFNDDYSPEYTGLFNLFYFQIPSNKHIDLSEMNLKRIPTSIASRLINIRSIDLSGNACLKLEEEWFKYFYDNLEELKLNNCNVSYEYLKNISNCKSLKKLCISGNGKFNINCILPILNKLIYLDVSDNNLNEKDFDIILQKGTSLEYLNFNENNLINLSSQISGNIKVLNVSKCNLNSYQQLSIVMNSIKLEEIDLSYNDLSELDTILNYENFQKSIDEPPIKKICHDKSKKEVFDDLKILNLKSCNIKDCKFIKNIFDIKGLEILNLAFNNLDFDLKDVLNGKAKNTLKQLNVESCKISSIDSFYFLSDFFCLEIINLSDNEFKNIPEAFSLGKSKSSLKEVLIVNSQINYHGLKAITDCSNLEKLYVSHNNFDNIPSDFTFGVSKNTLKELDAFGCRLNYIGLEVIADCTVLEKLYVSENNFRNLPSNFSFRNLKYSLKNLDISYCNLNHNGLNAILECEKIEFLNLSFNKFSNFSNEFNISFKNSLNVLEIIGCAMNIKHLKIFTDCPNLTTLEAFNNNLNSLGGVRFSFGCSKNSLKDLNLGCCKLRTRDLLEIMDCPKLESLELSCNVFKNFSANLKLGRSKETLKYLNLINSCLNYNSLKVLTEFRKLKVLIISENNFGSVPTSFSFKKLETRLEVLYMNSCNINYDCLKAISKCFRLNFLDISNNENLSLDSRSKNIIKYLSEKILKFYFE